MTHYTIQALEETYTEGPEPDSDWHRSPQMDGIPAGPHPPPTRDPGSPGLTSHESFPYSDRLRGFVGFSPLSDPLSYMHPEQHESSQQSSFSGGGRSNITAAMHWHQNLPLSSGLESAWFTPAHDASEIQSIEASGAVRRPRTVAHTSVPYNYPQDHTVPPNPLETITSYSSSAPGYAVGNYISLKPPEPGGTTQLSPDHPDWRLTAEIYQWLFAVLYPKRRPDKSRATPSGQCLLCETVCKRAGILQQHLLIVHRQRLARKIRAAATAGQEYTRAHPVTGSHEQLALAFAVAQIRSISQRPLNNPLEAECDAFLAPLTVPPYLMEPTGTDRAPMRVVFSLLYAKLLEFSLEESWVGAQCQLCGMWATRPVALEEHLLVCAKYPSVRD